MTDEHGTNGSADAPLNDLESTMFSLMEGKINNEEFLQVFLNSHLFIMVDGEPQGGTLGDKRPMVIASGPDAPRMLAVFSDPIRAEKLSSKFTEYNFPIMVDADWAFEALGPHMGLAFNPGCHFGFEIAPEGAQEIRSGLRQLREQNESSTPSQPG